MHLDSVSYSVWTKGLPIFGFCNILLGIFSGSYSSVPIIMMRGWIFGAVCCASFAVLRLSSFPF